MRATDQEPSKIHIFGIRHHGPGCARSVRAALNELQPDILLVEGPPDAQEILELAAKDAMEPPVAILVYAPDVPQKAVFYPFAIFSPEWQAIQYGLGRQIPIRFMDLPHTYRMAKEEQSEKAADSNPPDSNPESPQNSPEDPAAEIRTDPIQHLARLAGYSDGERWWDWMVEHRRDGGGAIFAAIQDAMAALREGQDTAQDLWEQRREAHMRMTLRQAVKDGFEKIAIVCGAWHGPALSLEVPRKQDQDLLSGLKKIKTQAAWVPWSYDQLSWASGYRAGVLSPEWYHLIWTQPPNLVTHWMTMAARMMRSHDLDISSAHVIESVRLAESLAAMRNRSLPGLEEMDEAALTVMCFGDDAPMRLIRGQLVIGHRLGKVPDDIPSSPLQLDFARQQKRLRFPLTTEIKEYDLDLRNDTDRQRSHLLHRLLVLDIPWGDKHQLQGKKLGTFHEGWQVQWKPEYVIELIHACRWGSTIEDAATAKCADASLHTENLSSLTGLLEHTLLADLPKAVDCLVSAIQRVTAVSADIPALMKALPPLARAMRYGDVRQTQASSLGSIVHGLTTRIMIHLPATCSSVNDDAAEELFGLFSEVHSAVGLIQTDELTDEWYGLLGTMSEMSGIHPKIAGRCCRILYEQQRLDRDRLSVRMSYSLSGGQDPAKAASWIEGFLSGSGLVLIHQESLMQLVDEWLCTLHDPHFVDVLPLLRRTFSAFPPPERRQIGQQIAKGKSATGTTAGKQTTIDIQRARKILPMLETLLGVEGLT